MDTFILVLISIANAVLLLSLTAKLSLIKNPPSNCSEKMIFLSEISQ